MAINRRGLFALGGLGAVGAATGASGPEVDIVAGAITIKIRRTSEGRCVLVPDFDMALAPGIHVAAVKTMPLPEFLSEIEKLQNGMLS